jgi:hypothetical protein
MGILSTAFAAFKFLVLEFFGLVGALFVDIELIASGAQPLSRELSNR